MELNRFLLAGVISSATLSACSPSIKSIGEFKAIGTEIIGGKSVSTSEKISESIVAVYDTASEQLCTGSLLPNNIVLTAAHCIGENATDMVVLFGLEINSSTFHLPVDKAQASQYWGTRRSNSKDQGDIALIHFVGKAPENFKPLTLSTGLDKKLLQKGKSVILAGYGISNGKTGEGAGTLRMTSVKIENPQYSNSEILLNQTEGTGACHGDSGGPAFIEINGKLYLWGVTSRGVQDADNDCSKYAAYTYVNYYRYWIAQTSLRLSRSIVGN